jgi:hypothetical protein
MCLFLLILRRLLFLIILTAVKASQHSGTALIGAFVGNKCEFRDGSIDSRAEVDVLEAKAAAEALGMQYFETSAVGAYIIACYSFCYAHEASSGAVLCRSVVYSRILLWYYVRLGKQYWCGFPVPAYCRGVL